MMDVSKLNELLGSYFAGRDDVALGFLFGSVARGTAGPLSDLDVAFLLKQASDPETYLQARLDTMGDIEKLTGLEDVDVVVLNEAPVALSFRVILDGILLYCDNRDTYIFYRVRIFNEHLDFKPILERYEKAILEKARKGELTSGPNPYFGALEHYRQIRERLEEPPE